MQSSELEKDAKKKLKALNIMADMFVFIILEFIEPTFILMVDMFVFIILEFIEAT